MLPRATALALGLTLATLTASAVVPLESLRVELPNGWKMKLPLKNGTLAAGSYTAVVAFSKSTVQAAKKLTDERRWISRRAASDRMAIPWVLVAVRDGKADPLPERFPEILPLFVMARACPNETGAFVHLYLYVLSVDDAAYVKAEYSSYAFNEPK